MHFFKYEFKINCIVIFTFLDKESNISSKYTYTVDSFAKYYKNINEDVLSEEQVKYILNKLSKYCANKEEFENYLDNLKNSKNSIHLIDDNFFMFQLTKQRI